MKKLRKLKVLMELKKINKVMSIIKLLDYQKKCFNDRSRFKILNWARGARKTFTVTLEIVDDCFTKEINNQKTTWVILSRGERQAKEALEEVKKHCKAYQLASSNIYESNFISLDGKRIYKQFEVNFMKGSRIIALPANPDTARGYSANVFLDEFCLHENDKEIWRALFPVLRGKYRLIIASTPHGGKTTKFYEIITGDDNNWSKHIVDIYTAVNQGLPFDIELEKQAMNDPDGWAQEYELKWIEDFSSWLSFELISSAETNNILNNYKGTDCYVGMDVGRKKDLTVIWVLEKLNNILWTRDIVKLSKTPFSEQLAILSNIIKEYNVIRCCLDATGLGMPVAEEAQKKHGSYKIEAITFTNQIKHNLAINTKKFFEDGLIKIPENKDIRNSLNSIKVIRTGSNIRFDVEGDYTGHGDYFWSLALAIHASTNPIAPIEQVLGLKSKRFTMDWSDYKRNGGIIWNG